MHCIKEKGDQQMESFRDLFTPKETSALIIGLVSILSMGEEVGASKTLKELSIPATESLVKILSSLDDRTKKASLEWLDSMGLKVNITELTQVSQDVVH